MQNIGDSPGDYIFELAVFCSLIGCIGEYLYTWYDKVHLKDLIILFIYALGSCFLFLFHFNYRFQLSIVIGIGIIALIRIIRLIHKIIKYNKNNKNNKNNKSIKKK